MSQMRFEGKAGSDCSLEYYAKTIHALKQELAELKNNLDAHKTAVIKLIAERDTLKAKLTGARKAQEELEKKINTPELVDFAKAVTLEAVHQRERWGEKHDVDKTPEDWFWLIGYLAGKALRAGIDGNKEKLLHHIITTAAVCNNWHAQASGSSLISEEGKC